MPSASLGGVLQCLTAIRPGIPNRHVCSSLQNFSFLCLALHYSWLERSRSDTRVDKNTPVFSTVAQGRDVWSLKHVALGVHSMNPRLEKLSFGKLCVKKIPLLLLRHGRTVHWRLPKDVHQYQTSSVNHPSGLVQESEIECVQDGCMLPPSSKLPACRPLCTASAGNLTAKMASF